MSVIFILIPLSILIAACFLAAFIWAVRSGQYEDTTTPSMRVLLDDRSAGFQPAVSPISNRQTAPSSEPPDSPDAQRVGNPRHSRLEICSTPDARLSESTSLTTSKHL
jgi:cbb3-type cytochrome oxidase maturation protein